MAEMQYDVTIITVRPGTHPKALAILKDNVGTSGLLACWYSDLGALNQILLIRSISDPARAIADREAVLKRANPFGVGEFITAMTMDTYVLFDFLEPMRPGDHGPVFEVRTYMLKPDGLAPTIALWRQWVPGRANISPLLAAMVSVSGPVSRFMHIWSYKSLDERARLRAQAEKAGVWPPPGGPSHLAAMRSDVYLAAPFSPMR